jgi:hypothetical protein
MTPFLEGIEKHLVESKKHGEIEKVKSSRITKGRMALPFRVVVSQENLRSLGCARDDKGEGWRFRLVWLVVRRTADRSG